MEMTEEQRHDEDLPLLSAPADGVPPLTETLRDLKAVKAGLERGSGPVAVDTERAQGRTYGAGAYLVQLRREGSGSFLIDPRRLPDLSSLQDVLAGEWILHAPDQDLAAMAELGLTPSSLFDTETAARLSGSTRFGLGALTEEYLGVRLAKAHQNEDWSRRPLPQTWLSYAALDVELLPQLRLQLLDVLAGLERLDWAKQEFRHLLEHPVQPKPNTWRNTKGLGKIRNRQGLAVARSLWQAREELGKRLDIAPGRLLSAKAIVDAAAWVPKRRRDMLGIPDFRRPLAKRHTDVWWQAIEEAKSLPEGKWPARSERNPLQVPPAASWRNADPEAFARLTEVRAAIATLGERLGLETEVVLNGKDQRFLAWWPLSASVPTVSDPKARKGVLSKLDFMERLRLRLEESQARPWQRELFIELVEEQPASFPELGRS